MLKYKVDPSQNIVVLWQHDEAYGDPNLITDEALRNGFSRYTSGNSELLRVCHASCFCVLAHGEREHLSGLTFEASLALVNKFCQSYRRGRRLLLLSCHTGMQFARRLSSGFGAEVIAATAPCTVDNGRIFCGRPEQSEFNPLNWIRITTKGEIKYAGSAELQTSFVEPLWLPNINVH